MATLDTPPNTAKVVACLNLLTDRRQIIEVAEGTTILQAAIKCGATSLEDIYYFVNGMEASNQDYPLRAGDLLTLRLVPGNFPGYSTSGQRWSVQGGGGKQGGGGGGGSGGGGYAARPSQGTPWAPAVGMGIGALGLGASLLLGYFGRSKDGNRADDLSSSIATSADTDSSVQSLDAVNTQPLLGIITGTTNKKAQYQRIPNAYGRGRFAPPIAADEQSEIQGNIQYATIAFELGYGPLNVTEQKLSDRPLSEVNATYELHTGIPGETPFTLLTKDASESYPNLNLLPGVDNTVNTDQEGVRIGLDIQFDGGLYQNVVVSEGGIQRPSRVAASVSLAAYYRPVASTDDDDYVLGTSATFNELQTNAFRRGMYFDVPRGVYTVKILRYTPYGGQDTQDSVTLIKVQVKDDFTNAFNDIKDVNGNVINFARSILKVPQSDQIQGSLGEYTVSYERLLRHWNGTTWDAPAVTENPADIVQDILQGVHNKFPVPDSRIDLEKFAEWWTFCDTRGLKFSKVFDTETSPLAAIREVCVVGRARLVTKDGKLSVFIDQPQTEVVQHFTQRNSWGFSVKATYGPTVDLLKMRFVNPEANYQADERFVFKDGKTLENFQTHETKEAPGVQDKDQAWKLGRELLADDIARRRVYKWYADHEAIVCQQGDLVRVSNPLIGSGLGAARIKTVSTNGGGDITGFTIDSRWPQETGKNYQVRIRRSDGSTLLCLVQTLINGKTNSFTFTVPVPAATSPLPAVGDLVMYGETPEESREVIITSVTWQEGFTAEITAVDHAPGIYKPDEPVPPFVAYVQGYHPSVEPVAVPVIWNVQSDESVLDRDIDGGLRIRAVFNLQPVASDVTDIEVSHRIVGGAWSPIQAYKAVNGPLSIYGLQDGQYYDFRVRARNRRNRVSAWNETIANYFVIGMTTLPLDVPGIYIDEDGNARVYYDEQHGVTVAPDFVGLLWKYHEGHNTNWATATIIQQLSGASVVSFKQFSHGLKTIMCKAVDVAGNESANPAFIVLDYGDYLPKNMVHTESFAPSQLTITGGAIDGILIKANDESKFWSSSPFTTKFWKGVPSSKFWAASYSPLTIQWSYTAPPSLIRKPFKILLRADIEAQTYRIEYRQFGQSLFWDGSPLGPTKRFWSGGANKFWSPPGPWLPMPDTGLIGTYGKVQFRIICDASKYRSVVSNVQMILDAPDIQEILSRIEIPTAAGVRLPVTADKFSEINYVNLSLLQDQSHPDAHTPEVVDMDVSGPLIKMRKVDGTYTGGRVNADVRGI